VKYFSNLRKTLGPGIDGWEVSLKGMMSIVVLLGLVITSIYWGVNKFVLNDPSLPKSDRKKKKVGSCGLSCFSFFLFIATQSNLVTIYSTGKA
jgi:ATP/ADP translocase